MKQNKRFKKLKYKNDYVVYFNPETTPQFLSKIKNYWIWEAGKKWPTHIIVD